MYKKQYILYSIFSFLFLLLLVVWLGIFLYGEIKEQKSENNHINFNNKIEVVSADDYFKTDIDTLDWITYKDDDLGIEFKHPSNVQTFKTFDDEKEATIQLIPDVFTIGVDKNEKLEERVESIKSFLPSLLSSIKRTTVSGARTYLFLYDNPTGFNKFLLIEHPKNNKIIFSIILSEHGFGLDESKGVIASIQFY